MKRILSMLLVGLALIGHAQVSVTGSPNSTTWNKGSSITDSVQAIPVRDTTTFMPAASMRMKGRLTMRPADSKVYVYNGSYWEQIGTGAGGGGGSGTLTNLTATNGTGQTWTITNATTTPNIALALTKAAVGLSNVDNTSDASKPVSTATATSIATKQDAFTSQTGNKIYASPSGTSGVPSFRALTTPDLPADHGTPTTLVGTNISGTATGLTVGTANALKSASGVVSTSAATAPTSGQVLTATDGTHATWQDPTGSADQEVTLTDGATITWNRTLGDYAIVTLGGDRTLDLTNALTPSSGQLEVIQDGTGSRDLTLPGHLPLDGIIWSTDPGSHDILGYTKTSKGLFWTNIESYGPILITLSTPTLTATTISSSEIDLSWNNVANEDGYTLERSPNGSSGWSPIGGSIPANTTAYNNTGLSAGTHYYYRVKADGDGVTYGDSGYGTDDETTTGGGCPTLCATPTGFCDLAVSGSGFGLSGCTENATGVGSGYNFAYAAEQLASSTDGAVAMKFTGVTTGFIGFLTEASVSPGASAYQAYEAGFMFGTAGNLYFVDAGVGGGTLTDLGVLMASGDLAAVFRTGNTFDLKIYHASSWGSSVHTYVYTSTAAHFAAVSMTSGLTNEALQHKDLQ